MRINASVLAACTASFAALALAAPLPGFERSPSFNEQVKAYAFSPDVSVHINAPPAADFDAKKPTRVVIYALPNGNTIAQTIGKQKSPGVDWHYFIQHIGAQTRSLRQIIKEENLVVAYVEAGGRSWPLWRKKHANSGGEIERLIHSIRSQLHGETTVELVSHSGGGSFIFGYLNHVESIPEWVTRIAFIDANYGFSEEQHHGDKLISWLRQSPRHHLGVLAYDDRRIRIDGKLIVGPTGGTYRKTQRMLERLRRDITLAEDKCPAYTRNRAMAGRIDVILVENPEDKILHTVLVEKNGFVHSLTFATPHEGKAGKFWETVEYGEWIQP